MKKLILGLNFYGGHDTSITALLDQELYALSQERVSRIKHDSIFPIDAIFEMIRYNKIDTNSIQTLKVAVATKKFENLPLKREQFYLTSTLKDMLKTDKEIYIKEFEQKKQDLQSSKLKQLKFFLSKKGGVRYLWTNLTSPKIPLKTIIHYHLNQIFPNAKVEIEFFEHHLCHAYSAFYSSEFENSLILSFDGEGDRYFSKLYLANKNELKELGSSQNIFVENMKKYHFADSGYASVGNIYSIFTHLLGYTPNADEGKVEALAAFGKYDNFLYHKLSQSYEIDKLTIKLKKDILEEIFNSKYLKKILKTLSKEDISASVQKYLEDVVLLYLQNVQKNFKEKNLCLVGGVTANVILNNKIFEKLYPNLYITPYMGDEGIALGALLQIKNDFKIPHIPYLGSSFTKDEIEKELQNSNLNYTYLGEKAYIKAAQKVVEGKIGALFHQRAEFGPRALGNRSIVANVQVQDIQKKINQTIKKRPLFQPFCPSIMIEEQQRLFEKSYPNKHMTIAFKLKEEFAQEIPGAVHIDLTSRVQFVSKEDNPNYYRFLQEVKKLTGFGVVINTSFNKHGRTMVLNPKQAIIDFLDTNLDFLVMEGYWIENG